MILKRDDHNADTVLVLVYLEYIWFNWQYRAVID